VAGLAAAFGSGAMTNSIAEFENADTIFITGSNTTTCHPLIATRIFRAKQNGAKIIVADPRKIQMAAFADIHVRQAPGTDVALLNGIMHVILENKWHDQNFIDERTEDFDAFKKAVQDFTPEKAAEISGVSTEDIKKIADLYANCDKGSIVYCMGITQHTTGVDNVKSLANLAMLTGNLGKESTGVNPLRGQNNVQGACDMGGLPNVITAYQPVVNDDINKKFKEAWNTDILPKEIGRTIPDMLDGLDNGEVKALYVLGENPVLSDPDVNHVKKALKKAELLVVQDIFLTETAQLADVVLPGVAYAEKDGTFSNTERRITRVRKAVEAKGEAREDWRIIQDISNAFGYKMNYESPEDIMKEIALLSPSYGGVTYDRLEGEGLQWPCPTTDHPGTPFLHKDRVVRGKGLFHAIEYRPPAEETDEEYPLCLTTGRVYAHYHTGTMTRNSESLDNEISEGFMEINPKDAEQLNIADRDRVNVASRRGEISTRVMITDRVSKGVVFMPFHFAENAANVLTNPACDPIAKIPEYKVCAVKVFA
jgi:formate dehydrogenase alpha subunit